MQFDQTLIRCSSLGCLFTEPKSAADKKAGKLSKTAQTHLIKTYISEYWGIEKDIETKQMLKGVTVEEDSITMLSMLDGEFYQKNEERRSNGYIIGTPDIVTDTEVHDVKSSWDAHSYLPKLVEPIDDGYYAQLQGYLWLFDRHHAKLRYCLVTTPESIRLQEKYYLARRMDVVTEESPDFLKEWQKMEKQMVFDHIPVHERVITLEVRRDEEFIQKIPAKVEAARAFLQEFHQLHTHRTPKLQEV